MNDISALAGKPRTYLSVGGETYAVYELTLDEMGEMQAWVNTQFGDPMEIVRAQLGTGLTITQEQYLLRSALELSTRPKPLMGTPEADALVRSVEGAKLMLFLAIRKGRPGFSLADADRLFSQITSLDLARAFEASGMETVLSDPKAAEGGPTTPS